jgi:uncharacterized protein (DUF608 family)
MKRRDFLKVYGVGVAMGPHAAMAGAANREEMTGLIEKRDYNTEYSGPYLNRVAFPIGGIGAGMICLEGTGAFSHFSLRNSPDIFNEPCTFAAISVKGLEKGTKILEGPVPDWKVFGSRGAGNGASGTSFGFPRFERATFSVRFPFASVVLSDPDLPVEVELTGWSPFIPGNADDSSLPVGALEYRFRNTSGRQLRATFSYNCKNFMATGREGNSIQSFNNGFLLWQGPSEERPVDQGAFTAFVDDSRVIVDHCWFRGGWWDPLTMAWRKIEQGSPEGIAPVEGRAPGASLFVPFQLKPGQEETIRLLIAWHVPQTELRRGEDLRTAREPEICDAGECCENRKFHVPWYASKFKDIHSLASYWRANCDMLRKKSKVFSDSFYDTTLPPEVIEAVAANLTILKSPTVMRQCDGRLWCWEGCSDSDGCCHGTCTHVWNYAQAFAHLFPALERSLRLTEFTESQDDRGHQVFRAAFPIRPTEHTFHAAADGQLGGIMKVHRDWKISGDTGWLRRLWPNVRKSLDYCIRTWDPKGKGVLEEPHHNTYDIEFWGPDGMCTSFYLGALSAAVAMGEALGDDISRYRTLFEKGRSFLETELFNGEYFYQQIEWRNLETGDPVGTAEEGLSGRLDYSPEALEILENEGPKYQYGTGCLSDGVLGFWIAQMCGLGEIVDSEKVKKSLRSIHKYNLKHDLTDHVNPQRPSYALGDEGGLLLCTWPKGGELSLPFVYSNEVWTGIEYQVASHLMLEGMVEEGLEIVQICRSRYDGVIRNPFNEYECGNWYARALASYGLIQGLTGVRYDAVEKTLYFNSKIGNDFRSFLATDTGFGNVGLKGGKPFVEMKSGELEVKRFIISGKEVSV